MELAELVAMDDAAASTTHPLLDDLFERHSGDVFRTAFRVTGNASDAEDVLQNVFLRVLRRRIEIAPGGSPGSYLRRAATRAAIDLLRRKQARPDWRADPMDGPHADGASASSPLAKEQLRRALVTIAPEDSELFVLCYLEGYSYDELAEMMGLERGTVGSRLHRIRAALRKELSK